MIKNILFILLISLSITGCYDLENRDSTNDNTQTQEVPEYQLVISSLEGVASTPEEYFELADAYMQRSGLVLSDVIQDISDSTKDAQSPFLAFVKSVQPSSQEEATSLQDLDKATDYHMLIIGDRCEEGVDLTEFEKEVCLYKGLAQTMEVANTINAMSDDISQVNTNGDAKLQASSCAMQYAFNNIVEKYCSISEVGEVTFEESNATYDKIAVYTEGREYEYLLLKDDRTHTREVVVTDGYCSSDNFETRESTLRDASYLPCPVSMEDGEKQITANDNLVDSLNEGTEAILAVSDNYTELATTVKEFRIEISTVGQDGQTGETIVDTTIDMQDMIEYLNEQNQLTNNLH